MQWSQLKHRVEEQFAPALAGRVQVWLTSYRTFPEKDGRAWLTLDGEQIYSIEDFPAMAKMSARVALWEERGHDAMETPATGSLFTCAWFLNDLHDYLRTGIADLLQSNDPLLFGLAVLDRRLGRRRFDKLDAQRLEHPLVKRLHGIRAEAEGWPPQRRASSPDA